MSEIASAQPEPVQQPIATAQPLAEPTSPILADPQVEKRANDTAWSVGGDPETIKRALQQGREDSIRQNVSAAWDQKTEQTFRQRVYERSQDERRPLTTDEMNELIQQVAMDKNFSNPKGVFEWSLSNKYFSNMYGTARDMKSSWLDDYMAEKPQEEKLVSDLGRSYVAKMQFLHNRMENIRAELGQQGMFPYLYQRGAEMIPGVERLLQAGNVPGVGFFAGPLTSQNLEQQRIELMRKEFGPDFTDAVDNAIKGFMKGPANPGAALQWLDHMIKGTGSEDYYKDLLNISIIGAGPFAKAVGMVGNMAKAAGSSLPTKVAANVAIGNIPGAATQAAVHAVTRESPVERVVNRLYDGYNLVREKLATEPNSNYRELTNRMLEVHDSTLVRLNQILKDSVKVDATADLLKTPQGMALLQEQAERSFGKDRVLKVGDPVYDERTNSYWYPVNIGTTKGGYWARPEAAGVDARHLGLIIKGTEHTPKVLDAEQRLARVERDLQAHQAVRSITEDESQLPPAFHTRQAELDKEWGKTANELYDLRQSPGVEIKDDGLGHYIQAWVSVDKTSPAARQLFLTATGAETPKNGMTDIISAVRTPGDTFSKDLFDSARVTTYVPNLLIGLAKDMIKEARQLRGWPLSKGRAQFDDLKQMMDLTRTLRDPASGELGHMPNVTELQDLYLRHFNRVATEKEIKAFYSWDRYERLKASIQDLHKYTNEANMGAMLHRVRALDPKTGQTVWSPWFVGVDAGKEGMPKTYESIMSNVSGKLGQETLRPSYRYTGRRRDYLDKAIQQGTLRSIRLVYPHDHPFKNWGAVKDDHVISHVIGKVESKPLEITHSTYRPWEYNSPFAIKQAIIKTDPASGITYYLGDRTVMNAASNAVGQRMVEVMNNARKLMADGNEIAAKVYMEGNVPWDWAEHVGWYESGLLTTKEDIRLVPKGQRIADIDNQLKAKILEQDEQKRFRDATLSPHFKNNPDTFEVYKTVSKGSKNDPLFHYDKDTKIDALSSINRSFHSLVNSTYLNDFKAQAIDQWIRDAKPFLKYKDPAEVDHSPYHFFYNGQYNRNTSAFDRSRLEGNRMKIQQILGTPGPMDTWLHELGQKLYDKAYETGNKAYLIPAWIAPRIPDASAALRSFAFHAVMSWNPVQILVQSMNYATIAGLAGYKAAGIGSAAGFFHQLGRLNNNWVPHFGRLMEKFGMRPGEFEEAFHILQSTGFQYLGKEHIVNEGLYRAPIISSGGRSFLDMSSMFFNSAERNQRFASFYTAYSEYRKLHPTGPITNYEKAGILGRADTLSGEMSSASRSFIQKGPLAFTAQFQGYALRMLELLWGNRISTQAKARTLATYGALFGIPTVAGMGTGLSAVSDWVRKKTEDMGYTPGEHWYSTMLNEGIPAHLIQLASGNLYNVGKRFATLGVDLDTDKSFLEILGGASAGVLSTALDQGDPLIQSMMSLVRGDGAAFTPRTKDLLDAMKTWSVFGKGAQLYTALNTHDWMSRRGQILDKDISPYNAWFMTLSGLQSQEVSSLRNEREMANAREKIFKNLETRVRREYQNYFAAERADNKSAMRESLTRINSLIITSGYPTEDLPKLLGEMISSVRETSVERVAKERFLKHVSPKDAEASQKEYFKRQELKGK